MILMTPVTHHRAIIITGLQYWSLSQYLKRQVKDAVGFVCDFEQTVAGEARRRGFDGVVCGHGHRARIKTARGSARAQLASVGPH